MVAPGGWSDAGGPDNGSGEGRGAPFVHSAVGGADGCGDATGASVGIESVGVADTGCGVVDKDVSALVSPSAVLMRCHRLGRIAWGSVMPASGDISSRMCWANVENTSSKVLGSQSLRGVLMPGG
jgi:hypothetical protein